jgi:hypothetical protein
VVEFWHGQKKYGYVMLLDDSSILNCEFPSHAVPSTSAILAGTVTFAVRGVTTKQVLVDPLLVSRSVSEL